MRQRRTECDGVDLALDLQRGPGAAVHVHCLLHVAVANHQIFVVLLVFLHKTTTQVLLLGQVK